MRPFEFPVDPIHARSANESWAELRHLRVYATITAVVMGVGTALMVWLDHPWSYILGVVMAIVAATSLWVAIWSPHRAGSIEKLYADGTLVPAVVAETRQHHMTILALVDVAKPTVPGSRYALVARNVRHLPGHSAVLGERVPSISVLSDKSAKSTSEMWQSVDPMPIAWGTTDSAVIDRARDSIGEIEWQLLEDKRHLSESVRAADGHRRLLAPHELPDELR